jgi:large subunit ribosomal protein L25
MQQVQVEGKIREERGKNAMRRIRKTGGVPGVLYGGKDAALALELNGKQLSLLFRTEAGHNAILNLQVAGRSEEKALLKDWLVDPVRGHLLHVDLLRVAMDVRMRVKVPVHAFGEPAGVKQQGGVFEMVTREVEIECLPSDIPEEFRMDVSELMLGKALRLSDLPLDPEKMKLVGDPKILIAHVVMLKKEEEVAPEVAAAAATAVPVEPEVIKKGKKELEEGEEAEEGAKPAKTEKPERSEKSEKKEKK